MRSQVLCYRSGPIERDPAASFHAKNSLDDVLRDLGINIIGDTFEYLKLRKCPQDVYGPKMKKLRNIGLVCEFNKSEMLVTRNFRDTRSTTFIVAKPLPEGTGGTTSEIVQAWFKGVPKLVIIGPHCEVLLDNSSTFVFRMITDRYALVFNTEKDVLDFVRKHIKIFRQGKDALRKLILQIKRENPHINDRPKPLYSDEFAGETVIILGRPGAGKGTQARLLQDLAGFKYFGSGHELRRLSNKVPLLGESLSKGNLAPDIIINYLLAQSLLRLESFEPIAIDGSPKKPAEAINLLGFLDFLKRKPIVIVIDIDEELSRQRIVQRCNCDHCEISFCGTELIGGNSCPHCGSVLTVRPENADPAAIDKIMEWYKINVKETIDLFEANGLVIHVDGNRSKDEIFRNILEILKK
ncbi:hypothetical protein A2833_00750 [Candidatus Azambacteria bacterium RIFCSPHIGHO2_01_FULL_44_55]|nr:MAG: hypothetical protein A3A18_00370 [Candidatus Azambacteria bacterium RIFCSPLOWO2_01_FULL_44_84]OGD33287.1 MAG: hypothetical protein A3C78_01730 [Candidatus Azambacteria bacterium RIFCSPHIGHO2_02_FULL_45_18]OGD40833.1 MAG: hypothetical protein A2833_00750 [Candidatus Azambacteria bacterium RIFCSPHIGHO2_01_FULL_44_55]OGD51546.1 MAG: hypothetical protein A2608_01260 [Candidatus Azambacteria bacterium RIFOXYD1_FULL_44_10]